MKYILAVIDATSKYSGRLVAFLSIPLIAVIMMGVVARYIFHSPFIWTHEMMTFLSAFIFAPLFYMKVIAPKDVTTWEIYKSSLPFVGLQLTALILCMVFPQIILFLPRLIQ